MLELIALYDITLWTIRRVGTDGPQGAVLSGFQMSLQKMLPKEVSPGNFKIRWTKYTIDVHMIIDTNTKYLGVTMDRGLTWLQHKICDGRLETKKTMGKLYPLLRRKRPVDLNYILTLIKVIRLQLSYG